MANAVPYLEEDAPLCARCSLESGGCCRTEVASIPYCFPLSEPEVERLLPYAFLTETPDGEHTAVGTPIALPRNVPRHEARDKVSAVEDNLPDFIRTMKALFPTKIVRINELFPAGGKHLRLQLCADGSCAFLGAQGCRLPRELRPWYCLMFPGWVQQGQVTLFLADTCLVHHGVSSPAEGLARIGLTPPAILALFACLERDWGLNP